MGTTKNILMQEFNGVDYDTLYPSIQPDFPNDLANMYIWKKWKNTFTEETKTLGPNYKFLMADEGTSKGTIHVSNTYDFDQSANKYYLINPSKITFTTNPTTCENILKSIIGKYTLISSISDGVGNYNTVNFCSATEEQSDIVYQFPSNISNATVKYRSIGNLYYDQCYYTGIESDYITGRKYTLTYYGYDLTPTHTPPTDEYSRDDLGILCDKGFYRSYVGTGNRSAVLKLQFPFQPRIVVFSQVQQTVNQSYSYPCAVWVQGTNQIYWDQYSYINFTLNENELQMTLKMNSTPHWNESGKVYYYWAR